MPRHVFGIRKLRCGLPRPAVLIVPNPIRAPHHSPSTATESPLTRHHATRVDLFCTDDEPATRTGAVFGLEEPLIDAGTVESVLTRKHASKSK